MIERKKLHVLVTGASGMVGEGVMHECLNHPAIEKVTIVGRRTCGTQHERLRELLVPDFSAAAIEAIRKELSGIDACFFCLGVTSLGKKEPEYTQLTYDLTLDFAKVFVQTNPGSIFCYVSGAGTDSTENGKSMWARVKGRTENDLRKLPFRKAYAYRPGYIHPTPGLLHPHPMYRYVKWAYPVFLKLFPAYVSTLRQVGLSMIHVARAGFANPVLEVKDINQSAAREEEFLSGRKQNNETGIGHNSSGASTMSDQSSGILPDRDLKKNLGC